jgi:hypothetical protein
MTQKEILDLYKIEFIIQDIFFPSGNKVKSKVFLSETVLGSYFNLSFNEPYSISEDLIPTIQHFIDGNSPEIDPDLGGVGEFAIAYIDEVRFYNPHNGEITFRIPMKHFKIIAEAWRDYLLA